MSNTVEVKQLKKICADNDYRYASLWDSADAKIVPWNQPKTKCVAQVEKIEKRLRAMPPGMYCVKFQNSLGKRQPMFSYYVNTGTPGNLSQSPVVVIQPRDIEHESPREDVRTWAEALADKEELARLRAENAQLAAELAAIKEKGLSDQESGQGHWLKDMWPNVAPAVDEYFKLENKKLDYANQRLAMQSGYGMGQSPYMNPAQPQMQVNQQHPFRPVPDPTNPQLFAQYLDWLDQLDDQSFNGEMMFVYNTNPQLYAVIYSEVMDEPEQQPGQQQQQPIVPMAEPSPSSQL